MNTTERELLERCKHHLIHSVWPNASLITDIEACLENQQVETLKPLSVVYRWTALKDGKPIYQYSDQGCPEIFNKSAVTLPTEPEQAKPVQESSCNPHPNAPHGFSRNASHSANRYVCECEGWSEKENVQKEPVQEPVAWMYQEYKRMFMDFNWFDEVAFIQPPSDSEQFRNVIPLYTSPQRELQPLVQIASDIMGACMNGDLSDKWEDVADLLVSNNFDGLSKPTQSRKPMSDKAIDDIWGDLADSHGNILERDITRFARAIEAHHGIGVKP